MANTGFILFRNVTIPENSRIVKAVVEFTCYIPDDEIDTNLLCYFEDADNPSAPTDQTDLDGRSLTSSVDWKNLEEWKDNLTYQTPNLASILQTVIDRDGRTSGNNVLFLVLDNGSVASRIWSAIEHRGGVEKATLKVTWNPPEQIDTPLIEPVEEFQVGGFTCTIRTYPTDANIYYTIDGSDPDETDTLYSEGFSIEEATTIKAKAFKQYWTPSDTASRSYSLYGWNPYFSDYSQMSGAAILGNVRNIDGITLALYSHLYRFSGVAIPAGATVASAILTVVSGSSTGDSLGVYLGFEHVSNADLPSNETEFLEALNNMTSKVTWQTSDYWSTLLQYNSPDVKTSLQQIINRSGWASGNSFNLILTPIKTTNDISGGEAEGGENESKRIVGPGPNWASYRPYLSVVWDTGSGTFYPSAVTEVKEYRKVYNWIG